MLRDSRPFNFSWTFYWLTQWPLYDNRQTITTQTLPEVFWPDKLAWHKIANVIFIGWGNVLSPEVYTCKHQSKVWPLYFYQQHELLQAKTYSVFFNVKCSSLSMHCALYHQIKAKLLGGVIRSVITGACNEFGKGRRTQSNVKLSP